MTTRQDLVETKAELEGLLGAARAASEQVWAKLSVMFDQVDQLQSGDPVLLEQISTLTTERDQWMTEHDIVANDLAQLRVDFNGVKDRLSAATEDVGQLEGVIDGLRQAVEDRNSVIENLKARIAELEGPVDPPVDPPPVPGLELHKVKRLLGAGPFVEDGKDYTGQQLAPLFLAPNGARWRHSNVEKGWPAPTRPQPDPGGCGIKGLGDDMYRLTLRTAGSPSHSATTLTEQYLPLDMANIATGGVKRVGVQFDFRRVSSERYRSIKVGGVVSFNDRWLNWPGGNNHPGPENFSWRFVLNGDYGGEKISSYFYMGADNQDALMSIDGMSAYKVSTRLSGNRNVQVVDTGGPDIEPGKLYTVRFESYAGSGALADGWARVLLREEGGPWVERQVFRGIKFASAGQRVWSRGYAPTVMYGGTDSSFDPQNASKVGILDVGNLRIEELEAA